MVNQKVAVLASHAAATHMSEVIKNIHQESDEEGATVYYSAFQMLLKGCDVTPAILEQRVTHWVEQKYPERDPKGIVGNLIKSVGNTNMGQKIFKKLVQATFPAE